MEHDEFDAKIVLSTSTYSSVFFPTSRRFPAPPGSMEHDEFDARIMLLAPDNFFKVISLKH
eukprot:NP_508065.1 Uncharacterized protein CELE_Y73B3A.8 [Caenorhabditis elegans]